eukprot:768673-Hanusia_phi.AAC.9
MLVYARGLEWRQAGISYLRYANICAQVVRRCLKPEAKVKAASRDVASMKITELENGVRKAIRYTGVQAEK